MRGNKAEYTYNADGLRKAKKVGADTTEYYYNGQNVINETKNGGEYAVNIMGVNGYISRTQDGQIGYFLRDAHGDIQSAYDQNGTTKLADYTYDAWGNQSNTEVLIWGENNPIRYAGQYYDSESGMIYLRARYYDTALGRFINEDPIKDGLNWYAYCGDNPVMFVDPSGCTIKNYNKHKHTFTADDNKLTWASQLRLADYKEDYMNGQQYNAHKNANLLRSLDHAFQSHFGWKYKSGVGNQAPSVIDRIGGLSYSIFQTSLSYGVSIEMINAVLAREITCYIPGEDVVGSSVGIAQINPATVLSAYSSYYGENFGLSLNEIEKLLKNNYDFSVQMCGLILANIARQKDIDLSNCNAEQIKSIFARYNGTNDYAKRYGNETYEYYTAYKEYNGV